MKNLLLSRGKINHVVYKKDDPIFIRWFSSGEVGGWMHNYQHVFIEGKGNARN